MPGTILVTGGAGFIGSNLVRRLLNEGYNVRIFDSLKRCDPFALDELDVEIIQGDILDEEGPLQAAMQGVDACFHLAAYGSVVESVADPRTNFAVNAQGTLNVLCAARDAEVEKFVFSSTGGALIGDVTPPVNEQSLPRPISPYGASKLVGEAYLNAFSASYGMKTTACRFANIYGPGSAHKKGAITVFIKCLMTGDPIPIYGDGSATRDQLFVLDLCEGLLKALQSEGDEDSRVFHLASGIETPVLKVANELLKITAKPDHPIEHLDPRPGEVHRNFATYDKAKAELGFTPQTDFPDGLRATWEWFQMQGNRIFDIELTDS